MLLQPSESDRPLGDRFMVSLSNHEAICTAVRATPSWFDKLTLKAF
jgi:hypothetical protein